MIGVKKSKRIHVINALEIGGVEVGVLSLLNSCHSENYEVVCVKGGDDKLFDSLSDDLKQRIHRCNGYLSALFTVVNLKPDIVVTSLWRAHVVGILCRLFLKKEVKYVHFVHLSDYVHLVDKYVSLLSLKNCRSVFTDSTSTKKWLIDTHKCTANIHTVPMNISFSNHVKTFKANELTFCYFGRYSTQKNLFKAIDFIKLLNDKGYSATYNLYGRDDGLLAELIKYTKSIGQESNISFHESLLPQNVESKMREHTFYLQTSDNEGMAISVYQSIVNGLIPVVTPVGEINSYCKDMYNAFFIDSIDASVDRFISSNIHINGVSNPGSISQSKSAQRFDCSFFYTLDSKEL